MNDPAPDVTILVPDLRAPTVGAAVRMRDLLAPAGVEIVGPDFGGGVCALYRNAGSFVCVPTRRLYRWPDFAWESRKIDRAVRGKWVIAVKAYLNTVPVALRLQARGHARAAVFLDEWDGAAMAGLTPFRRIARFARHALHPLDHVYHPVAERRIREASLVLSTTSDLQRRFGGHVIALGVDTERFKPLAPEATAALRAELGLTDKKVIGFGGVVRPHKGVELILEALDRLNRSDAVLLVIGPITDHLKVLRADPRHRDRIRIAGAPLNDPDGVNAKISERMPEYLDIVDCVALPLTDSLLSRSQMPIKVFEAMAMAKPVIASAVGDLPSVLGEHGIIVPPGDARALAAALSAIFDDPISARNRGGQLRQRCIQHFSRPICGQTLRRLLDLE